MYVRPWDANPELGAVAYPQHELERQIPAEFYQHEFPEVARHLRADIVAFLDSKGCRPDADQTMSAFFGTGLRVDEETMTVMPPTEPELKNLNIQIGFMSDDEMIPHCVVVRNELQLIPGTGMAVISQTYGLGPDNNPMYSIGAAMLSNEGEPILENSVERMPYIDHPDEATQRFDANTIVSFEMSRKIKTESYASSLYLEQDSYEDLVFYHDFIDGDIFDPHVEGVLFVRDALQEFRDHSLRFANGVWY